MARSAVSSPYDIDSAWLQAALDRDCVPGTAQVADVRVEDQGSSSNASLAIVRVTYRGQVPAASPARLFLKMTKVPDAPGEQHSGVGRREVRFYGSIAPQMTDPPVPHCYDAVFGGESQRFHLLLEDLTETHHSIKADLLGPLPCRAPGRRRRRLQPRRVGARLPARGHQGTGDTNPAGRLRRTAGSLVEPSRSCPARVRGP